MKNLLLLSLLLAAAPAAAFDLQNLGAGAIPAAPVPPAKAAPADPAWAGAEFGDIFGAGRDFSPAELSRLRGMRVLLVPGFMSNLATPAKSSRGLPFLPGYFTGQRDYLRSRGVDCRVVDIESETGIYDNARKIVKELEQAPGKVIIVGHSKGGLDTLEALLKRPDLRRKVHAVIAVQSPFLGSHIADLVLSNSATSVPSALLLDLLGGSKQSLQNLSVKYREAYHRRNAADIKKLAGQVPFYSYATWKEDPFLPYIDTVFEVFRDYLRALGHKNDGLVPAYSAVLPGSRYVYMEGVDHLCTVMPVPLPFFDRAGFIRAALKLALRA